MKCKTIFLLASMMMLAPQGARGELPALLLEKGVFAEKTKGDIDAAIKIYKRIVDDTKISRKYAARALYRLGVCYVKQKKNDDAIVAFRMVVKHFADRKFPAQRAAGWLSRLDAPAADDSLTLAKRAWRLWNQRKLEESEKLFRQAVEKDPKNSNAWNGLGWVLQNQGKGEAAEAFKKCLTLEPKNSGALNGMGWIAKLAGKEDQAIAWWQKAVMANKHTTAALRGLTTTFMARGQYHQAAVCYAAWVQVDPNNKKLKTEMDDALAKAKVALAESKKARAAAEKWLALLDEGNYAESWDASAELFRKGVAKTKWVATIERLHTPLGKVKTRVKLEADYRTSLPGRVDGEYVVFIFKTTFTNKKNAIETVTPMKGKDGKWRVSGYYIK